MSAGQRWRGRLTPRQAEVTELAVRGLTDQEIADDLGLTYSTVKYHVKKAYDRLGVSGRVGLVAWWVREVELGRVVRAFGREVEVVVADEIDEYAQFRVALMIDGHELFFAHFTATIDD
jgi:DNA-binding CsgD family transcriptional regulator